MKLPLIVISKDNLILIFFDAKTAEEELEVYDIISGEYSVFDAAGKQLETSV